MKTKKSLLTSLALAALIFSSCEKDNPVIPNEQELITTVKYTLTPSEGEAVTLSFIDLDGDGTGEPTKNQVTLKANQTYTGSLELLNESETPAESITEEIEEKSEEHQFFFESELVSFEYKDNDADGNPVGLNTLLTTGDAGTGSIKITLRHEPKKSAESVSSGNITNAGGETDIEVTFNIHVE